MARILSIILALTLLISMCPAASLAAGDDASVAYSSVPSAMTAGKAYAVVITMQNTGTQVWTAAQGYRLACTGGSALGGASAVLSNRDTVKPGAAKRFSFTFTAPSKPGTYTVTCRMAKGSSTFGAAFTWAITVLAPTLNHINIHRLPKKRSYYTYEKLDLTGLSVTGTYNNGTKGEVPVTAANISGFDSSRTGPQRLGIRVGGKRIFFLIKIYRMPLSFIALAAPPSKRTYAVGEALDLKGLGISGIYTNGRVSRLAVECFTISGFDSSKVAAGQKVTLKLGGRSVSFTVNIVPNALMKAQAAAHAALSAALSGYHQADYSASNWAALNSARTDGDAAIDAADAIELVDSAKEAAMTAMDAVKTLAEEAQELRDAKAAAHLTLSVALNGYKQADYRASNWAALNQAKEDGDTAIDAAVTVSGANSAMAAAVAAMAKVMTMAQEELASAKAEAKAVLTVTLLGYQQADYSASNWMALNKAKADGDAAINAARDVSGVSSAKAAAIAAMAAVKTVAQEELEAAKAAAKNALAGILAAYKQSDYIPANWTLLNKAKTDGDAAIDAAASCADVDSAKVAAIAAMAAVRTRAQESQELFNARAAAHGALNAALSACSAGSYSSANWQALNNAKRNGDAAIDGASTPAAVEAVKTSALSAMAAVKTLAQEAQDLADAKAAALVELAAAYAGCHQADYSTENWTALYNIKVSGDATILAAASIVAVDAVKTATLNAMAAVKTKAQVLAGAKSDAHAELNAALSGYRSGNYSEMNWAALNSAKAAGDANIDSAADLGGVEAAKTAAINAMAAIDTKAEELAQARTAALAELAAAYTGYDQAKYSDANWTALRTAKSTGDAQIAGAADVAGVETAKTVALNAMDAVMTLVEEARLTAHTALASIFSQMYARANYSDENWAALCAVKTHGDEAIDAAATVSLVNAALNAALNAMGSVKTLAEELADAKAAAHQALASALNGYVEAEYSEMNWAAMHAAKTDGDMSIDSASSVTDVQTAKMNALNAMAAIPKGI